MSRISKISDAKLLAAAFLARNLNESKFNFANYMTKIHFFSSASV